MSTYRVIKRDVRFRPKTDINQPLEDQSQGESMERINIDSAVNVVANDVDLPNYVFAKRFLSHFFFDSNLGHPGLTDAIRELVTPCLEPDTSVAVFSAYRRTFLGWLDGCVDWSTVVDVIVQRMLDEGDFGGMIWTDCAGRLAVYQRQPVDLGIVALDADISDHVALNENDDAYFATDYFYGPSALKLLLEDKSERGLSLCESNGREFIQELVKNYS